MAYQYQQKQQPSGRPATGPRQPKPEAAAIDKVKAAAKKRGVNGIKSIGRMFRIYDDDRSRTLNIEEFSEGLRDYGVDLSNGEMKTLFSAFDRDGTGNIDYEEFLRELRPPMSEARKRIIGLAFNKMDKTGDGVITIDDMKGLYDARCHTKYKSGEYTEKQVFLEFLARFEPNESTRDGKVTKKEFEEYYAGVSASIDEDVYFDYMMRQTWKL